MDQKLNQRFTDESKIDSNKVKVGDRVSVRTIIRGDDKDRIQRFEGIVIAKRGKNDHNKTITVRKISRGGIGVEKIFPLNSPLLEGVDILKEGDVKRSKLYYLRKRIGRKAMKVREKVLLEKQKSVKESEA
jgi:large subunit ribosomal protein L19